MPKLTFPSLSHTLATEAWTKEDTRNIPMDVRIAAELVKIFDRELSKPNLGNATTRQLLEEIAARSDLDYKTVNPEI